MIAMTMPISTKKTIAPWTHSHMGFTRPESNGDQRAHPARA